VQVAVAFQITKERWGQTYLAFAGLWIPGDASRPNARLLPSNGDPDRRVPIGQITISDTGQARLDEKLPETRPGGDFEITQIRLGQDADIGTLHITWDVRTDNPGNVQPFCHLDSEGSIAIGGGRSGRDMASIDYARSQGLTLRDDSILVEPAPRAYFSDRMAQDFWPTLPVILESGHYGYAKSINAWGDGSEYLRAVEDYHGSYVSIHANPIEFLRENRDLIDRMNLRIGYRLNLVEASWPTVASRQGPLSIASRWANVGVAPCYPGGHPAWSLFDAEGRLLATLVDTGFDVRSLSVGPPGQAPQVAREHSFALPPHIAAGEYEVRVSMGDEKGTPTIALPLSGDDGHRRYSLGRIALQ